MAQISLVGLVGLEFFFVFFFGNAEEIRSAEDLGREGRGDVLVVLANPGD